ncbi:hypothetical protein Aple_026810 [Acrocarpospora pleiomorpha]|uniref:PIN domain-containing protein n=1 Tax=Acrocarpospora pleiomorpha TaxID=90975 RepID=A0A5M3XDW0_9ACTN|nr:hypothetical protein [Acrocarpospora pleiomorpha]GES19785.1 hypothetical protein Aple_026810 [Acrocarpospora pleiomorpha]
MIDRRLHLSGDVYTAAMIGAALEAERPIVIPALVLARAYREAVPGPARERLIGLVSVATEPEPFDEVGHITARDIGTLCQLTAIDDLSIGHALWTALERRNQPYPLYDWAIVTEHPEVYHKAVPSVPTGWR